MKIQLFAFAKIFQKHTKNKISIVALIMGATMLILSCNQKVASDIPPELLNTKIMPTVEATDFQTSITDSGVVRYFLKTPKMLIFNDKGKSPYKEFPEGFHMQQFDAKKKIVSELSANYGKQLEREQKWLATGNVVLVNTKGDTLRTEELIFLEKENKIYSEKFVSIKRGDRFISGLGGFESDTQMNKTTFRGGIQGNVEFEDQ